MGFSSWPLGNEGSWVRPPAASLGAVAQAGFGGFLAELFDLRHETMADFGVVDFSSLTNFSEMLSKVVSNQKH